MLDIYTRKDFFREYDRHKSNVPGSWWQLVERSHLHVLADPRLEYNSIDPILISAFVERWYPETNTFHFAFGEIAPTLLDVLKILELPIHGRAVRSAEADIDGFVHPHVQRMFGFATIEEAVALCLRT